MQCSKLRVRPAPDAHISVVGCTFFNELLWLYTRGVHGEGVGRTFYEPVHSDRAHNQTLISNTGML